MIPKKPSTKRAGPELSVIGRTANREKSLMPDGLADGLAVEKFRDLVAYLESLK